MDMQQQTDRLCALLERMTGIHTHYETGALVYYGPMLDRHAEARLVEAGHRLGLGDLQYASTALDGETRLHAFLPIENVDFDHLDDLVAPALAGRR